MCNIKKLSSKQCCLLRLQWLLLLQQRGVWHQSLASQCSSLPDLSTYKKISSLASYDDIGISRGQKADQGAQEARTRRMVEQIYGAEGFFCGPPGE